MHRKLPVAAAVLSLLIPCTQDLCAQSPDHLVSVTRVGSVRRHDHAACAPLGQCTPFAFPDALALPPQAGGTAWDPFTSGAWISNGQVLAKVADDCSYQCPPQVLPGTALIAGLEVLASRRRLFAIDDHGFLHQYSLDCPPQHLGSCPVVGAVTALAGPTGLAIDEGLGLVFIAQTDFAQQENWLLVAQLSNACQVVQRLRLPFCPTPVPQFGACRGLAVDWCRRILYATDGFGTVAIRYAPSPAIGIAIQGVTCCTPPVIGLDPMLGLAVRPGGATAIGQRCSNGSCPPCPMRFALGNDPEVGNTSFHLELAGAPVGSLAWALVGLGPCQQPGVVVPPLCGPVHTLPLLGSIGPVPTGPGTAVCGGNALFRLGLPANPTLCGTTVSAQGAVLCSSLTGQIGTALSECLTFRIQGS